MIWTDEMAQMLIDMYKQDCTMAEIAKKMNEQFSIELTRSAIAGRIHRMNLRSEVVKIPRGIRAKVDAPIPPPEPAIPPTPVKVEQTGITIYQLNGETCRWPGTDVDSHPPYLYCGEQVVEMLPYCPRHCALAYNAPQKTWY